MSSGRFSVKTAVFIGLWFVSLCSGITEAQESPLKDTAIMNPDSGKLIWIVIAAFLVFFMQTGFCYDGNGAYPCKELNQYHHEKFYKFLCGFSGLLADWIWIDVWRFLSQSVWHGWICFVRTYVQAGWFAE